MNQRLQRNVAQLNAAGFHFIYVKPPESGTFPMGHPEWRNQRTGTLHSAYALAKNPTTVGEFRRGVAAHREKIAEGGVARFALRRRRGDETAIVDTTNETSVGRALAAYEERVGEQATAGAEFMLIENPALTDSGALAMPDLPAAFAGEQQPMVLVTRKTVQLWLDEYLTPEIRRITGDAGIRAVLPTEEQWEYAATDGGRQAYATRGGTLYASFCAKLRHLFTGSGRVWTRLCNLFHPVKLACFAENATKPVGTYPSGPGGFNGLTGNVFEMTSSAWEPGSELYVGRGGSWDGQDPLSLLAADRRDNHPDGCYKNLGFRVGLAQDS